MVPLSVDDLKSKAIVDQRVSIPALRQEIYERGYCAVKQAFTREWAQRLREEYQPLMEEARAQHQGTISRGHNRFYHAIQPQRLSGFVDLVTNPILTALCEEMLGPDYLIVEIGFDTPLPGAKDQPWHRDFPLPTETRVGGWLSSLAFNLTTVDVTPEMGAFQIAPGTQFEDGAHLDKGMFPRKEEYARYEQAGVRCYPQMGDMSCRTGLTIHRGTEHNVDIARPVLVLGVIANVLGPTNKHKMYMTKDYFDSLPADLQSHLKVEFIEKTGETIQAHEIEELSY